MQLGRRGLVFTRLEKAGGGGAGGRGEKEELMAESDGGKPSGPKGNGARRAIRGSKNGEGVKSGKGAADVAPAVGGDGAGADQAMETMQYDRMAIAYLSLLLLPLVVGFSVKKLIMDEHAGWYSWALQSLTVSGAPGSQAEG